MHMAINENRYVGRVTKRLLVASLAFIVGLAAYSVWENHKRISDFISDFIANYED